MIDADGLITLEPIEEYTIPDLPTYTDNNSNLKKKVPARWKNKAVIAAVAGLLGSSSLAGCSIHQNNDFTRYDCGEERDWHDALSNFAYDLCVRLHHGGFGTSVYVAHLTEQEVFGIIKMRLEEAGFNFNVRPPSYYVKTFYHDIALDLFDKERSVGVAHISWIDSNTPFSGRGRGYSKWIAEQFAEQTNDITFGVFNTPGEWLERNNHRITEREAKNIRPILLEDLNEQLEDFIAQL